ncbi:hypothetical protein EDD11_003589 [Mortierella claussenii]|nr:hypothetical protein EDD11_003589 [Mortierella claussenii]
MYRLDGTSIDKLACCSRAFLICSATEYIAATIAPPLRIQARSGTRLFNSKSTSRWSFNSNAQGKQVSSLSLLLTPHRCIASTGSRTPWTSIASLRSSTSTTEPIASDAGRRDDGNDSSSTSTGEHCLSAALEDKPLPELEPFLVDAVEDNNEKDKGDGDNNYDAIDGMAKNVRDSVTKDTKKEDGQLGSLGVPRPWTAKDRQRLEELLDASTTWPEIAKELQRNQLICKSKWEMIQKSRFYRRRGFLRLRVDLIKRLSMEGFGREQKTQFVRVVDKQLRERLATSSGEEGEDLLRMLKKREDPHGNGRALTVLHTDDNEDSKLVNPPTAGSEVIDWERVAVALGNKFTTTRLRSIYDELASVKLIWTPEEDDRLMRAVIRMGGPKHQLKLWAIIKDALQDDFRSAIEYKIRWRNLEMSMVERAWDESEKTIFWRRWAEYQKENSIFSTAPFVATATAGAVERDEVLDTSATNTRMHDMDKVWDVIAEGLPYRHGRDCQRYFEQITREFPKDQKSFQLRTQEVADAYLKPKKARWTAAATRTLVDVVKSYKKIKKLVDWTTVVASLEGKFTRAQCVCRWNYWLQSLKNDERKSQEAIASGEKDEVEAITSREASSEVALQIASRPWTDHELEILKKGVQKYGRKWAVIRDALLPHRSTQTIYDRYWRSQAKKTGPFSVKERDLLEAVMETHGEDANWNLIAAQIPGRTAPQCRKHWNYVETKRSITSFELWSHSEKEQLREAVARFGTKWGVVSDFVVGKSPQQCRAYWRERANPNVKCDKWSARELDMLMERVAEAYEAQEEAVANSLQWKDQDQSQDLLKPYTEELAPQYGGKQKIDWRKIAKGIAGRTAEQCRLAYLMQRQEHSIFDSYYP